MNWIVTCDGHEASLEFPTHADYEIERIAHSLAQINRFNGRETVQLRVRDVRPTKSAQ